MSRKAHAAQSSLFLGDVTALRATMNDWRASAMPSVRAVEIDGRRIALDHLTDADTPAVAEAFRAVHARIQATRRACARSRIRDALRSIPHA